MRQREEEESVTSSSKGPEEQNLPAKGLASAGESSLPKFISRQGAENMECNARKGREKKGSI